MFNRKLVFWSVCGLLLLVVVSYFTRIERKFDMISDNVSQIDSTVCAIQKDVKGLEESVYSSHSGIGAALAMSKDGFLTVIYTIESSPAEKAGLKYGDKILKIDDVGVNMDLTIDQALSLIRGEVGTNVSLIIARDNEVLKEVDLTRDTIRHRP
jgi:C-terminal processing protease CtpA/Prc